MTRAEWMERWGDLISDAAIELAGCDDPYPMFVRLTGGPDKIPYACWLVCSGPNAVEDIFNALDKAVDLTPEEELEAESRINMDGGDA